MENKFEEKSSLDYVKFMDQYEKGNPVVIPDHILELIRKQQEENNDPNLSYERWEELTREYKKHMAGSTDDDLYFQLYYARKYSPILVPGLEERLRPCHCGSGKKFSDCHGA